MILDEPTNHLDIQSRNILIESLKDYKGTFVVVSHDRHFLDEVANKIWYAEDKGIYMYPGTYSEFHYHQTKEAGQLSSNEHDSALELINEEVTLPIENKREQAERRNRLYKELVEYGLENMENWQELSPKQLQTALSELESKIHTYEDKKTELEEFLADPSNFKDKERADQISHEYSKINEALGKSYDRWELVTAHMEDV